jgi:CheY-like chemotaxis protein
MRPIHNHLNRALNKINKTRISILIVEDDDTTRRLAIELFRSAGFIRIAVARSIDEAIDEMRAHAPDLILLSWGIGGEDGLDLVRTIRNCEIMADRRIKNFDTPIILMSSRRRLYDVHTARNAGITEFIVKPFSATSLMKAVASALTKPRLFVESATYVGPCRRRHSADTYGGKLRRQDDQVTEARRRARTDFVCVLLAETKNMVSLMAKAQRLDTDMFEHIRQRTALAIDRAQTFKLKNIVTTLHSLNDYLSYWGEGADLRLIRRHFLVISRLCQPLYETPEECRHMVENLKTTVVRDFKIGKKRA